MGLVTKIDLNKNFKKLRDSSRRGFQAEAIASTRALK